MNFGTGGQNDFTSWYNGGHQCSTHRSPQKRYHRVVSLQLSVAPAEQFFKSRKRNNTNQRCDHELLKTQNNKNLQFSINGWCLSQNRANKKQENRPLTNSNPLKTAIFSPNLFLTFSLPVSLCQELPSTPLRLTRTRQSPPSCRLQTAGPESPLQTGRNWSGPPAVLGARSLWRCKQTRRR